MPIHPSFQKILGQFTARYGEAEGKKRYYMWLNKLGLDDTKPYSNNQLKKKECLSDKCTHSCAKCLKESFQWAKPLIKLFKKDEEAKYYQVEAHFAVSSMNNNVYTLPEMMDAIHLLPGQHVDLNHNLEWIMKPLEISAAMIEDECAECIIRVPNGSVDAKGRDCQTCFEDGTYHSVSIEADSDGVIATSEGNQLVGLRYTGLAVLDEEALPGIPLTTIQPLEKLMAEAFQIVEELQDSEVKKTMAENTKVKEASAAYCPLCGTQLVEGKCPNKECAAYGQSVQVDEKLDELNMALAKKETLLAEALEKQAITQEQNSKLTEDLAKTKAKYKELEGRLRTTETRVSDRDKRIDELEHDIEALREDIGRLTAAREAAITEKNEALSKASAASERANSEIQERAKIQRELADLREKTAGAIRREAETSEKLAFESNKHLEYETELKQLKEDLRKRDEAIKQMQAGNEKAIVEQKRLYKILKENNIYEIDKDGNLIVPS